MFSSGPWLAFSFYLGQLGMRATGHRLHHFLYFVKPTYDVTSVNVHIFLLRFLPTSLPRVRHAPNVRGVTRSRERRSKSVARRFRYRQAKTAITSHRQALRINCQEVVDHVIPANTGRRHRRHRRHAYPTRPSTFFPYVQRSHTSSTVRRAYRPRRRRSQCNERLSRIRGMFVKLRVRLFYLQVSNGPINGRRVRRRSGRRSGRRHHFSRRVLTTTFRSLNVISVISRVGRYLSTYRRRRHRSRACIPRRRDDLGSIPKNHPNKSRQRHSVNRLSFISSGLNSTGGHASDHARRSQTRSTIRRRRCLVHLFTRRVPLLQLMFVQCNLRGRTDRCRRPRPMNSTRANQVRWQRENRRHASRDSRNHGHGLPFTSNQIRRRLLLRFYFTSHRGRKLSTLCRGRRGR